MSDGCFKFKVKVTTIFSYAILANSIINILFTSGILSSGTQI
jgi:hypothetical protein